jgi:opacity protein-like surface antigen
MAVALSIGPAQAQSYYIEAGGGVTTQDELDWGGGTFEMDDGHNFGVAVGRDMWTNWDAEVELSYNEMEYTCCNPNNTHEYRLMANATRNFSMGGFTPYLGGGLGAAWVTYETGGGFEAEDTVAAYQLVGGARVVGAFSASIAIKARSAMPRTAVSNGSITATTSRSARASI